MLFAVVPAGASPAAASGSRSSDLSYIATDLHPCGYIVADRSWKNKGKTVQNYQRNLMRKADFLQTSVKIAKTLLTIYRIT